jgi:hypothetical protein
MEGISDIKICGIDTTRPPRIRKEPYINLYFKLSHKAPVQWCDDFNHLVARRQYSARISPADGLFIETWVRLPEEIPPVLKGLKEAVRTCNERYIARIQAEARAAAEKGGEPGDEGEQGRLNRIIAGLDFDGE